MNSNYPKINPIKIIIKYLRIDEWLVSKVTMMMGILMLFGYVNETPISYLWKEAGAFFLFCSMFLAVSYVANDYSDIEIDRLAGKKKVIALLPKWAIFASFFLMIIGGNVPIFLLANNKLLCVILIVITYFLGLAYSTCGLRFKEKGVAGLIECSFAQRCMPLFLIFVIENLAGYKFYLLIGWIILSFVDGLRYILIHQTIDLENDIKSGVKTFVSDKNFNGHKLLFLLLLFDMVLTAIVLSPIWMKHMVIMGIGILICFLIEYCIYYMLSKLAGKDWLVTFDSVPMELFLNMFMPILIGLCMSISYPYMLIFSGIIFVLCSKAIWVKLGMAWITVDVKIRKRNR